jgi:hypothetical protein
MPPKRVYKKKGSPVNRARFDTIFKQFEPNINLEISPDSWVLTNRVKFSQWIHDTFVYPKDTVTRLFPSQRFVKDFLQYESPYRGLLLFHSLGVGKTCASIVAAENLIGNKDVVVLLPASLRANYIEEIKNTCSGSGNRYFSKAQNWKFIHVNAFEENIEEAAKMAFVSMSYVKKQKGLWIPTRSDTSNWDILSGLEKEEINKQLDHMIENKYTFINYNGIKGKNIDEMIQNSPTKNPFDEKVVVIDEVHNLISRTVGNGRIGKRIYELLLNATNVKLILLSGTPMINYPYEVAYIVNLLKGTQSAYTITFSAETFNQDAISKVLDKSEYVDNYEIDYVKKITQLQLVPIGFKFVDKKNYTVKRVEASESKDYRDMISEIKDDLKKSSLDCKVSGLKTYHILPIKRETFNTEFIDFNKEEIKNPRMLARRMSGCISYFSTFSTDLYPELLKTELINVKMSPHQFNVYEKNRYEERRKEDSAKRRGRKKADDGDIFKSTGQVYRAYSRANCNFVFPEEIKRPYPEKMGTMVKEELDVLEDDVDICIGDECDDKEGETTYHQKVQNALKKLRSQGDKYLKGEFLNMLSPKFAVLIDKVNECKGKALVYSQFRTVEGLGVFSEVLNVNGWSEFKIKQGSSGSWELDIPEMSEEQMKIYMKRPKYFQYYGGTDQTKILMKIFNNDMEDVPAIKSVIQKYSKDNKDGDILKLIMITQSGAEGISLKHVREVHVLEPYWNEVRIQQVIGRAIRANSHTDLPIGKRNVSVYRYLISMTKEQIKNAKTIQNKDNSMTTDEYIYDIAKRKAHIIGSIQELMKGASVDCLVHNKIRDKTIKCIGFPENIDPNELSYKLDLEKEETDFEYKQKTKTKTVKVTETVYKKCTINGRPFAYDPITKTMYDYNAYMNGRLERVGKLKTDLISGKMKLIKE